MTHHRYACRTAVSALALALALSIAPSSHAETDSERAARLYREANAAVQDKNWADAEIAYLAAWKIARTFDVAANLGLVELKLGKHDAAARFLSFSLRNVPPSAKPQQRERTREYLDEARKHVGVLRVKLTIPEARVTLDGRAVDADKQLDELFVTPGAHVLEARLNGYHDARVRTDVSQGASRDVLLALVPLAKRPNLPIMIAGSAVAVVGVATGIGLLVAGAGKASNAEALRTQMKSAGTTCTSPPQAGACTDLHDANAASDTLHNAGVPLIVVGNLAAAGTLAYALWPRSKTERSAGIEVTPLLGPGNAGITFGGRF